MDKKSKEIILYFLINIAVIVLYHFIIVKIYGQNNFYKYDILNKIAFNSSILSGKYPCCSYWPISHFIVFALLSWKYPSKYILLTSLGFIWEIIELILNIISERVNNNPENKDLKITTQYTAQWWDGNWFDIFFNTIGIITGIGLSKIYPIHNN